MKTNQVAALFGVGVGLIMIYLAFNSGERVIVGALPSGQPIFDHVTNKPLLIFGGLVVVASILAFALSYRTSPAASAAGAHGAQASSGEAANETSEEEDAPVPAEGADGPAPSNPEKRDG